MIEAISKLDSFVQRCVDHAAFAVMRTFGVRKSFVRSAIYLAAGVIAAVGWTVLHSYVSLVVVAVLFGAAEFLSALDSKADAHGKTSPADFVLPGMKAYWVVVIGISVAMAVRGEPTGRLAIATNVLMLLVTYLQLTPNTPPPKEKREMVMSAVGEGA